MKIYANYTHQHVWCNDINFRSFVNRKIKMVWHLRSKSRSFSLSNAATGVNCMPENEMVMKILSWLLTAIGKINLNFGVNFDHRFTLDTRRFEPKKNTLHCLVALKMSDVKMWPMKTADTQRMSKSTELQQLVWKSFFTPRLNFEYKLKTGKRFRQRFSGMRYRQQSLASTMAKNRFLSTTSCCLMRYLHSPKIAYLLVESQTERH